MGLSFELIFPATGGKSVLILREAWVACYDIYYREDGQGHPDLRTWEYHGTVTSGTLDVWP